MIIQGITKPHMSPMIRDGKSLEPYRVRWGNHAILYGK
jgi:hypothetical protein